MLSQYKQELTETIGLKRCCACTAEMRLQDRFCRRCGTRQANDYVTSTELTGLSQLETAPLTGGLEEFKSYSGELIRIITLSMPTRTRGKSSSRGFRGLVCTLITIPIWMLIVMLSPLDAFAAARAASGRIEQR